MPVPSLAGIYVVLDAETTADLERLLDAVLRAGVRLVQYRAKTGIDRSLVRRLHRRSAAAGAVLIVNDDLAAALDADGLHVGQEDLAASAGANLRAVLGPRLFGISAATPAHVREAERLGADYIGAGPYRLTATKPDAGAEIGTDGLRAVVRATRLPVAAIGGIGLAEIAPVAAAGAAMAAIISAVAAAPDPEAATRALVSRWNASTP
jgi:thiamine-phosphate diphosphorylase